MTKLSTEFTPDNLVRVRIGDAHVDLSGTEVSLLIDSLASLRTQQQPQIPARLPQGYQYQSPTLDPVLALDASRPEGKVLLIRHNGYGWVPYAVTQDGARQFVNLLADHIGSAQ